MKPRNIFVPLAMKRKAGVHQKTFKAQRRLGKVSLRKEF